MLLYIPLLLLTLYSPIIINAECCNTSETRNCCDSNDCLKLKKNAANLCILRARDLQAESAYINNATVTNLNVINDDRTNGTLVADSINVVGTVNVNGTLDVDGGTVMPETIDQYGYFILDAAAGVADGDIVPFDTTVVSGGITRAPTGVYTFSEAGIYLVNYTGSIANAAQVVVQLVYDPAGAQTPIPSTTYAATSGNGDYTFTGITVISVPTAGTTIGLLNISGGAPRAFQSITALANVSASFQVVKIGNI